MFLIHKTKLPDQYLEYVRFDDGDIKHHIMNRVNWKVVYEEEERDRVHDLDLLWHIEIAMDDDTELLIVPAKEVKWSPYDNGYFYY